MGVMGEEWSVYVCMLICYWHVGCACACSGAVCTQCLLAAHGNKPADPSHSLLFPPPLFVFPTSICFPTLFNQACTHTHQPPSPPPHTPHTSAARGAASTPIYTTGSSTPNNLRRLNPTPCLSSHEPMALRSFSSSSGADALTKVRNALEALAKLVVKSSYRNCNKGGRGRGCVCRYEYAPQWVCQCV